MTAPSRDRPSIELRSVSKRYLIAGTKEVVALADVDLEVRPGEVVVVLGPSGCGKTTLLNLIGGLDQATDGSIVVEGRDLSSLAPGELGEYRRRSVSFGPERPPAGDGARAGERARRRLRPRRRRHGHRPAARP